MREAPGPGPETLTVPARMPRVCGAIGSFDRRTVEAVAAALPGTLSAAVERDDVVLMADRPLRTWAGGGCTGYSWGRALPPGGPTPATWQQVAERGDVGLVLGADGPQVHSSTNGASPLYWYGHGSAIYFATGIDALALNVPGPLTADWDTWSSLLLFGTANGPHTPFQEIHRLPPQSVAFIDRQTPAERSEEWPWLAIEPTMSVTEGTDAILDAVRSIVDRLPRQPTPLCLSGGLDSRLLATIMAGRGLDVTAYTVNADSGNDREERAAAAAAEALGFRHVTLRGTPEEFWRQASERALASDFLRHPNPWLSPVHEVAGAAARGVMLDGLGGDQVLDGGNYVTPAMLGPDEGNLAGEVWRGTRIERGEPLVGDLGDFCVTRARRRLRAIAARVEGHPNRSPLVMYWMRSMNGISHVAFGSLGSRALVEGPFVCHEVASVALAVDLADKQRTSLRKAVIARVNPGVARIPSNHDRFPATTGLPVRRRSEEVLRGFQAVLTEGPLAPWVSEDVWAASRGERSGSVQPRRIYRTMEGVVSYHLWVRRYGDRVGGTDPAEALGISPP